MRNGVVRAPTTHIFKPPTPAFDGHAENQHFSIELARALGLPVVDSRIMHFQNEIAIVVERYDRLRTEVGIRRVHQEDICQALAILSTPKYQNGGGPGISDIVRLLRTYSGDSQQDIDTFIDSVAFNWLIVGTDAYAKNYALLIGTRSRARLAPLYNVASILPYTQINLKKTKLAMNLGGEYHFSHIQAGHWNQMAQDIRLDPDKVI
jgi:serine/threonine-protein kinase HipA